jgi:hypothetical protein
MEREEVGVEVRVVRREHHVTAAPVVEVAHTLEKPSGILTSLHPSR